MFANSPSLKRVSKRRQRGAEPQVPDRLASAESRTALGRSLGDRSPAAIQDRNSRIVPHDVA